MNLFEAKEILKRNGYSVINEREINLNYLLKDIFELLTSFGISATDDEVERLMRAYINSGHKPENSNAEDILEFDIDNAPDTIIDYTSDFIDWIKSGQYKTSPADESVKEILNKACYLVESNDLSHYVALVKQYLMKNYTEDDISLAVYPGKDNESVVVLSYFRNIPERYRWEYSWKPSDNKVKMTAFASNGNAYNNGHESGIETLEDFYAFLDKSIEAQFYE